MAKLSTVKLNFVKIFRFGATFCDIVRKNLIRDTSFLYFYINDFNYVADLGYKHQAVNHSVEYVRADGVHTNDIESLCCDAKRKFKAMNGCSLRSNIPSYLDEWMWKRKLGDCERFDACVAAIPFTR